MHVNRNALVLRRDIGFARSRAGTFAGRTLGMVEISCSGEWNPTGLRS
jgi:hypothetical protein